MRQIVKSIYDRHTAALHGVTAGSTWIDHAAASLSLWLALEELDSHHIGINPATNGSIGRWRKLEEDVLNLLDDAGADGEYAGDPGAAVRKLFDDRNGNIIKLAECVDAQAVIIEDLRQQLRQALAAQPPTVHVNGNGPKATTPADADRQAAAAGQLVSALTAYLAPPAPTTATYTVTPADEVDYPPTPATKLPAVRVNWLGLPVDLQSRILQLDGGEITWRSLANTDRRAITLYAIPRVGGAGMSMSEWLESKPAWMPTASALAQMFGLRWTELVAQAHKVMVE